MRSIMVMIILSVDATRAACATPISHLIDGASARTDSGHRPLTDPSR